MREYHAESVNRGRASTGGGMARHIARRIAGTETESGTSSAEAFQRRAVSVAARWPIASALLMTALVTVVLLPLRGHVDEGSWGIAYVVLVAAVGAVGGVRAAVASAVAGFACWNFFFTQPYYTFDVADSQTWIALVAFLVISFIVGVLTSSAQRSRLESQRGEWEARLLARVSSELLSSPTLEMTVSSVLSAVDEAVSPFEAAVLLPEPGTQRLRPRWLDRSAEWRPEVMATAEEVFRTLRAVGASGGSFPGQHTPSDSEAIYLPLHSTTRVHGVLYVGAPAHTLAFDAMDRRLVGSIALLASTALEQLLLADEVAGAEAQREADTLKSSVVSSVSHELRTPLAGVVATVTGLLESPEGLDERVRAELEAVVPDLHRLESAISDLLDLSRLEGDAWRLRFDTYEIGEVVGSALSGLVPAVRERITLEIAEDLPPLPLDFRQVVRALRVLLDNAAAYAPDHTPIVVGAKVLGGSMSVWVRDEGPGIPLEERELVFEKFYRSSSTARLTGGTGLGLAIVREVARGHGGTAWVETAPGGGALFSFTLALDAPEAGTDVVR